MNFILGLSIGVFVFSCLFCLMMIISLKKEVDQKSQGRKDSPEYRAHKAEYDEYTAEYNKYPDLFDRRFPPHFTQGRGMD